MVLPFRCALFVKHSIPLIASFLAPFKKALSLWGKFAYTFNVLDGESILHIN